VLCKVAPSSRYHVQDVNRAGGIMAIIGILARAGLIKTDVHRVDYATLAAALAANDIGQAGVTEEAKKNYLSAPANAGRNLILASQENYYPGLDLDRSKGCIRDIEHCYFKDGGLAVLYGNIAQDGCIVKTAGVDPGIFEFSGKARVFDSQEAAAEGILGGKVAAHDVVVVRYEGPKGGPGMQEMLYPTSYLKSLHIDKECALLTDGRFSGGTSGLSIGHVCPEAAAGGAIGLLKNNDVIEINIPKRSINVKLSKTELAARLKQEKAKGKKAFTPKRTRVISEALKAYAFMVASADVGAVRIVPKG
jgi:dihydroxy-acid dehydratase